MSARFVRLLSIPSSDPAFQNAIDVVASIDGVPTEVLLGEFQAKLQETYPDATVVSRGSKRGDGEEHLTWFVYRDARLLSDGQPADA